MDLLAVKVLPALLRGVSSRHVGDFYCLNYFPSDCAEIKLRKHKHLYKNHDYCYVEILNKDNKMLKYNHGGPWKFHLLFMLKKRALAIII